MPAFSDCRRQDGRVDAMGHAVVVGGLPDMLTSTRDGNAVLVANEVRSTAAIYQVDVIDLESLDPVGPAEPPVTGALSALASTGSVPARKHVLLPCK